MTPRPPQIRHQRFLLTASGLAMSLFFACAEDDQARQAALRDLQQQKQLTAERDREIEVRNQEIERLKRQVADAAAAQQNAQKALDNATRSMEDLARAQVQAEARTAQFRKLVAQFRKMTEAGKLKVEIRDNRMIVSVGDKILFDPGKTQLKKDGAETLKEVATVLKDVAGRDFQVAGHTDNVPIRSARFRSNWELSTARAVEVVNFMVSSGMQPGRLSAAGYADQAPIASNDTSDGRMKNRRIEITLMPNLDDLPPIAEEVKEVKAPPSEAPPASAAPTPKASDLPGPAGAPAPSPAVLSPPATPMSRH